ncbi:MAG: hypothetical protein HY717_18545, partial [Planctomycetes bacterium]|nr:hypothetical protein [Planctomycetota bacterium]
MIISWEVAERNRSISQIFSEYSSSIQTAVKNGYLAQAAWRVFPWAFKALAALLLAAGALQIAGLAPAALSWFDLRLEE